MKRRRARVWRHACSLHGFTTLTTALQTKGSLLMNDAHNIPRCLAPTVALLSVFLLVVRSGAKAQATTEYGGNTSMSTSMSTSATAETQKGGVVSAPAAAAQDPKKSPHLTASSDPSPEITNRQSLERTAGKDAGKLLLRSVPAGAQVWIDGAFVGTTPILLVLAPRRYDVQMKGQRLEVGQQSVDLLPHENREVALTLAVRYPTRVSVR